MLLGINFTNSQLVRNIEFVNNMCPVCGKEFKRLPHVHRHYVETHMHHADFKCPKCQRKFKRRYLMEHHAKMCNGKSKFQCWSCHTVYSSQERLIYHMENKHDLFIMNS